MALTQKVHKLSWLADYPAITAIHAAGQKPQAALSQWPEVAEHHTTFQIAFFLSFRFYIPPM